MFIKSIVLDGFKSYGQRTEIAGFDPLFNAITGLNGSGKSNVLDSICFVLGISNLQHVRANSLQELIYKSGQAGINKATVSITFDNRNKQQCPPGFEAVDEIIVTRQIALGGKNKYLINGMNANSKRVQDLFCSVQLNVNNPHFLIMQGRITKVLNMKPAEILSMVEEAAGTRMYEVKRQTTQRLIEKKDSKLSEFESVINEELAPKLAKLRSERDQFLAYQRVERELEHLMNKFHVWQFFEAKRNYLKVEQALEYVQNQVKANEEKIKENKADVKKLDSEIEEYNRNDKSENVGELHNLEEQLKELEKQEAKANAHVKGIKDGITMEEKKKKQLQKKLTDDENALHSREAELNKVQSLFETLKENERVDSEAFALAEKKYEALCAGMEVNNDGEAETLAEQLMKAREEASRASTESKQASMRINFCESQLKAKAKEANTNAGDYESHQKNLQKTEREVAQLEASMNRLNFSQERMNELQGVRRGLHQEIRQLRDGIDSFEARRPHTAFKYRDPQPNFDRRRVIGVACKLFQCRDSMYATGLEIAAGGKLYNVVVDSDSTSKALLQRGDLQTRATFIPLNKISANKIDQQTVNLAQSLVGKDNVHSALSLINYDRSVEKAMEYLFGNVFICTNLDVARKVCFHDRIRRKCVTLGGDVVDPAGVLTGGAEHKGEPILKLIQNIQQSENELREKEEELSKIEREIGQMSGSQDQYNEISYKLAISKKELEMIRQRLMNTTFARQKDEVDNLKAEIDELKEKVKSCNEVAKVASNKAKELEVFMKDAAGYREKRLKEAETEMKKAKAKSDKSQKEWREREQDYETMTLEIQELMKSLENTTKQLKETEEKIVRMQEELEHNSGETGEIKERVKELRSEVGEIKAQLAQKNKEMQTKNKQKEKLLAQNTELELEIKKSSHEIKELTSNCKNAMHRQQEYEKKMNKKYLDTCEGITQKEGQELEKKIKRSQEEKYKLGRTINAQAQSMFDVEEKRFEEILRKQRIVNLDRSKLMKTIKELDEKKEKALLLAFEQVSKDFGSIFGTLLPGANAKLVSMKGKSILQGLEIKVALGTVWKESLTELSGGQRSLAALSLILAMLLFKPAPLYILDEVDAALDLSHTQNIGRMLRTHFKKSQFIIVSLKDGMFNNANVLFKTRFIDGVSAVQRTENTRKD